MLLNKFLGPNFSCSAVYFLVNYKILITCDCAIITSRLWSYFCLELSPDVLDNIDKISAFAVENMKIKSSWEFTEKSYANVLHETGRFTTISALEETRSMFPNLENTYDLFSLKRLL